MERGFQGGFFPAPGTLFRLFRKKNKKDPHGTEAAGAKGDCMAGKILIIPGIFHVEVCEVIITHDFLTHRLAVCCIAHHQNGT